MLCHYKGQHMIFKSGTESRTVLDLQPDIYKKYLLLFYILICIYRRKSFIQKMLVMARKLNIHLNE